jgi:hypothetical protein
LSPVILLALLVAGLLLISWYKRAPSGQQKRIRGRMLLFAGLGIVLLLLVTGRLNPVIALVFAALAIGQRILAVASMANMFKGFRNSMKAAAGPSAGHASDVETRFLRMTLDHDTGAMDGVVLEGAYRGRRLAELALDDLLNLLAVCRAEDSRSATVLEAYLDRVHGDGWRDALHGKGGEHGEIASHMTPAEAREILGVGADAGREEIVDAHRRLMQKNHPDRGGSTYLAAKINQAKDILLA